MKTQAIILAAGQNNQFNSSTPRLLHPILGRPMIYYSIEALYQLVVSKPVIVIEEGYDEVKQVVSEQARCVHQAQLSGTGFAVLQAENLIKDDGDNLVVTSADLPMISKDTYNRLIKEHQSGGSKISVLTTMKEEPGDIGRVIRNEAGSIIAIVDAAPENPGKNGNKEIFTGVYCFNNNWLWQELHRLCASRKENCYLSDLVAVAVSQGHPVKAVLIENRLDAIRIVDRTHIAQAEHLLRAELNRHWMLAGVTIIDPSRTYIEPQVKIGRDTIIWPDTYLLGNSEIGENCVVGPNTILRNTIIKNNCRVIVSILEEAQIEDGVDVGPFSHLRRGTHLDRDVHVGNFGEIKNSYLGPGTKMGHFSYIGDATIAGGVNIGAGAITCNFDGVSKQPTQIEANVFVGSDTLLVAPVKLEEGSRTGAGSVVTKDVPANTLVAGIPARAVRKLKKVD